MPAARVTGGKGDSLQPSFRLRHPACEEILECHGPSKAPGARLELTIVKFVSCVP
jgi:hypothetical protein